MTTYYVSPNGSDANNGLGPDASHATNKPFLTIGKLIATSGAMASGDTAYVAPGTYRQVVTVGITSPTVETKLIGDVENGQGFKDGSGVLLAGGEVIWTAYLTNDVSAPSASSLLTLSARDFLTFERLRMISGSNVIGAVYAAAGSTNIVFRECVMVGIGGATSNQAILFTGSADVAANWLIDRCVLFTGANGPSVNITLPTSAVADYDVNFEIRNCLIVGGQEGHGVLVASSGAAAFKAGGVDMRHCTVLSGNAGFLITGTNISTTIPCVVRGCLIFGANAGLSAGAVGQIDENYNQLLARTPRTNVTAGANSAVKNERAPLLDLGGSSLFGLLPRPFATPLAGSPQLGFGTPSGSPTVDLLNRPRPAGGASLLYAVGALERHDTAAREVTIVDAGGVGIKLIGPADQDLLVAVDAAATVLSIKVRYDTTHGTTNKPQALLLANGEIGVAAQTLTAAVGVDTWETLIFAGFTPTAAGWVTLRLVSRAAAGGGIAYFDTASIA